MTRPGAADDFAAIRERLEVLLRERARMRADDASDAAEKHRYAAGHKPADKPGLSPTIRRASCR